jgi:hypothetical protein
VGFVVEFLENSAHLHVLLNHVPTVGFGLGLAMFIVALVRRKDALKRTSLAIFFVVANIAIATYTTGNAAEAQITARNVTVIATQGSPSVTSAGQFFSSDRGRELRLGDTVYRVTAFSDPGAITLDRPYGAPSDASATGQFLARPGISPRAIRGHEDAALWAFAFMEITGFFAWIALWQWRATQRLSNWSVVVVSLLALMTFAMMARTATLGGDIHHEEVRSALFDTSSEVKAGEGMGIARTLGGFVNGASGQTWVWATCETLHFIGLCMLFTVVLIIDLRMLGMMKSVSFAALFQLLPIGILGFGINLITGMMFFIGTPDQYVHNGTFFWKIVFVLLGGLNVLYFLLDDEPWTVGAGDDAPVTAKLAAVSAIFIWAAVLFCGHMLPFLGNSF